MKTKFNENWLLKESPCSDGLAFARQCNFDFAKIYDICERGDWLIWLLRRTKNISKSQSVEIAITCAEHVILIYEKKYPNNKAPRNAINAAKKWLKDAYAAYAAAYAADAAAAYAAAAADAAAYAADAAAAYAAAADAAAYAADAAAAYAADAAAAYAAAAADAAAYAAAAYAAATDARLTERKWQANQIRKIVPNPFTP